MCAFKSVLFIALSMGLAYADTPPLTKGSVENGGYPASVSAADVQYSPPAKENEEYYYNAPIPSGQAYEGAVYDPNMAYTYASPDAIQQYVGGGLIPYQGGFPGYPHPGGYAVQSGYEGFLVPSFPGPAPIGPPPVPANFLAPGPGFFDLIREVMPFPRSIFNFVSSLGMWLLSGFGVVVAGGAMTTGICMFTPLCSISFALPFLALRDTAKKLGDVIEFDADTADRVRRAADFVQAALEKYNKLQETLPEDDAQTNAEADAN